MEWAKEIHKLPVAMSILCEGNYEPILRRDYIYQIILATTNTTLNKMGELPLDLKNLKTKTHFILILRPQLPVNMVEMSEQLRKALVFLWNDLRVKKCYQDNVEGTAHPSAT